MTLRGAVLLLAAVMIGEPANAQEIRIGLAGPFSGPLAASGERNRAAADLAVRSINAAGGVLGRDVALVTADDACGTDQAAAAALDLVKAGVAFVVGHMCSHSSLVAAAIYEAAAVPMMSPDSTHPRLTEEGRANVFRLGGRDDEQGRVAGDWLASQRESSQIAIIHDGSTYGTGLAKEARARLHALGVTERLSSEYRAGASDYGAVIEAVREAGARLLYIGGYGPDAGRILRSAQDGGYAVRVAGGDGLAGEEFWSAAGPAGNGTVFTARPEGPRGPEARNVLAAFRALGLGDLPSGLGAYAAVQVWAQAARRAGTPKPEAVAEAIHHGRFRTVLGLVVFDAKGDLVGADWQWYRWQDGRYAPLGDHVAAGEPRRRH